MREWVKIIWLVPALALLSPCLMIMLAAWPAALSGQKTISLNVGLRIVWPIFFGSAAVGIIVLLCIPVLLYMGLARLRQKSIIAAIVFACIGILEPFALYVLYLFMIGFTR